MPATISILKRTLNPPDHVGAESASFQPYQHHPVPQVEHSQILKTIFTTYNTNRCHKSTLIQFFGQMDTPIQLPDVLQVETLKIIEIFGYLFYHKLHQQMPLVYT